MDAVLYLQRMFNIWNLFVDDCIKMKAKNGNSLPAISFTSMQRQIARIATSSKYDLETARKKKLNELKIFLVGIAPLYAKINNMLIKVANSSQCAALKVKPAIGLHQQAFHLLLCLNQKFTDFLVYELNIQQPDITQVWVKCLCDQQAPEVKSVQFGTKPIVILEFKPFSFVGDECTALLQFTYKHQVIPVTPVPYTFSKVRKAEEMGDPANIKQVLQRFCKVALLNKEAPINPQNLITGLHIAAAEDDFAMMNYFLTQFPSQVKDRFNRTPMDIAQCFGKQRSMRALYLMARPGIWPAQSLMINVLCETFSGKYLII